MFRLPDSAMEIYSILAYVYYYTDDIKSTLLGREYFVYFFQYVLLTGAPWMLFQLRIRKSDCKERSLKTVDIFSSHSYV